MVLYIPKVSTYISKQNNDSMAVKAHLQTKLACVALVIIILNVCLIIGIIAIYSKAALCKILHSPMHTNNSYLLLDQTYSRMKAKIFDHPWMLAFLILPERLLVGSAAIISMNWAITTAHSVEKASQYPISKKGFQGGSDVWYTRGYYHYAEKIISHELYDSKTLDYDLALIKVKDPFINKNELPLKIARKNFKIIKGSEAKVTGWGSLDDSTKESDNLLVLKVTLFSPDYCNEAFAKNTDQVITDLNFSSRMLCAFDQNYIVKTQCNFDSGGALVQEGYLIGLVCWGVNCGNARWPGVYTDIHALDYWIKTIKTRENIDNI